MPKQIPLIDLFAGPGGLNEGFSRYIPPGQNSPVFTTRLSVEMDEKAHRTLQLRAMYRYLQESGRDEEPYWRYVVAADHDARDRCGRQSHHTRNLRKQLEEHAAEGVEEAPEPLQLGEQNDRINEYLTARLDGTEPWVLLGGPPCQAYSIAGKARMRNIDPERFARDHRHTLYQQYLRVVARWRPSVFVMENVRGMLSSEHGKESATEGAIVHQILADLESPAAAVSRIDPKFAAICHPDQYDLYSFVAPPGTSPLEPSDLIIKAEKRGIPQARHRVIILGVRRTESSGNWAWQPIREGLLPERSWPTVQDAIGDLPSLQSGLTGREELPVWSKSLSDIQNAVEGFIRPILRANTVNRDILDVDLAAALRKNLASLRRFKPEAADSYASNFGRRLSHWQRLPTIRDWYRLDDCYNRGRLQRPLNHYCKDHMASDLARYFFIATATSLWEDVRFRLKDFPDSLQPNHRNARQEDTPFVDRFRAQRPDQPSLTVLSHLSKDGHYFIHHDPLQIRCISVREAARLQTFSDDYFFEGGKTAQYQQVGNAVPPMLATLLAETVHRIIDQFFRSGGDCGISANRAPARSHANISGR